MNIYVAHSRGFDYKTQLYRPLQKSVLAKKHRLILPHLESVLPIDSKGLMTGKKIDAIIAEVSFPATGLGIELGWADLLGIPITCIIKSGNKISNSLKAVSSTFIEYSDSKDMTNKLTEHFNE